MNSEIKMLIAGGCFLSQNNIASNLLYHQIVKNNFKKANQINLDISLIRYDSIRNCYKKISDSVSKEGVDIILFHLRVEPILLSSKLYCKYYDNDGKLIKHIRIAGNKLYYKKNTQPNPRLHLGIGIMPSKSYSKIHKIFRELNYLFGYFTGNWSKIIHDYLDSLIKIMQLCKEEKILLIVTGPVSRPYSYSENKLSFKLHKYMCEYLKEHKVIYLNSLSRLDLGSKKISYQYYKKYQD